MSRITTRCVIALMPDDHADRDRSVRERPGDAVRLLVLAGPRHVPVSRVSLPAELPRPAAVRSGGLIHFGPERLRRVRGDAASAGALADGLQGGAGVEGTG